MNSMIMEDRVVVDLLPAEYNPRVITNAEMNKLKKSIEQFGVVEPIVWNKRTNRIVGGHQRVRALKELGVEKTKVIVVDLTETDEKILNLALNKISGSWDETMLISVLNDLRMSNVDLQASGFDAKEIDKLLNDINTSIDPPNSQFLVVVECENESRQRDVIDKISSLGITCKALLG